MTRFHARAGGLAALVTLCGALALSSSAFGAVAGGANTPPANVLYPQVTSAAVTQPGANQGGAQPQVTACFSSNVHNPGGGSFTSAQATMFTLRGFNVFDSLPATGVVVATGNGQQSCLVLTFPAAAGGAPSAYVQGFTKLDIAQGAVASFNTGNPTNPPEAAQLDGSDIANAVQAGGNSGPVLTGFRVNPNGNGGAGTVVYDFDKVIPCPGTVNRGDPPTPSDFGFYSSTSTTGFTGTPAMNASNGGIVSCNPTGSAQGRGEVEVSFASGAPVSSAVRAFTTFGAVGTLDHTPQSTPVEDQAATQAQPSAPGGATINPYIVSVSQSSPGSAQFAITYNETVNPGANLGTTNGGGGQGTPVTAGNICAQLSYGGQTCAKGSANVSGSTVTVTFPAAAQFVEKIVSISDNGGAVDDQSTTMAGGNPSSVSSAPVQTLALLAAGYVDSDSLHQCTVNTADNTVGFQFVGPTIARTPVAGANLNPGAFHLVNTNGAAAGTAGSVVLQADQHTVIAQFQSAEVAASVACEVDGQGNGNAGPFNNRLAVNDNSMGPNDTNTVGLGTASTAAPGGNLGGGSAAQAPNPPSAMASGGAPGGGAPTPIVTTTTTTTVMRRSVRVTEKASKRRRGRFTRFHISGRITLPAGITRDQGCKGNIAVTIKHANRTVSHRTLGVRANCTYSAFITINAIRLRGRKVNRASVRFEGNNYLLASSTRSRRV